MTNPNPLASLWLSDTPEMQPMTPHALRQKAETFRQRTARRNAIDYLCWAVMAVVFSMCCVLMTPFLVKLGSGLTVLAILFAMWGTRRKASASPQSDLNNAPSLIAFYRGQVERQQDAFRESWKLYVLPFLPGVTLFILGTTDMPFPESSLLETVQAALPRLLGASAILAIVLWMNAQTARRLNQEIVALDKLSKP